jgi:hypothetical protein
VGSAQLVRFLVVELKHSGLNPIFNMSVVFILSVGGDVPVNNDALLVINFVNLKIKLTQSFKGANRSSIYILMFIEVSDHVLILFLKKGNFLPETIF